MIKNFSENKEHKIIKVQEKSLKNLNTCNLFLDMANIARNIQIEIGEKNAKIARFISTKFEKV